MEDILDVGLVAIANFGDIGVETGLE